MTRYETQQFTPWISIVHYEHTVKITQKPRPFDMPLISFSRAAREWAHRRLYKGWAPVVYAVTPCCLYEESGLNPLTVWRLTTHNMGRTAPLTSKRCILYIYSTNIGTEYFKHALYSPFFFSSKCSLFHSASLFGSCIIHILYTGCAKVKKNNSGAKGLIEIHSVVSESKLRDSGWAETTFS